MTNNNLPDPHLRGTHGDAWLLDVAAIQRQRGVHDDPRNAVSLPTRIVSAAYAHPMWTHYLVLGVALRDVPGVPPAKINMPGATHEVLVFAIDPGKRLAIDAMPALLQPVNFAGQFVEADDSAAAARIEQAVRDVIAGTLNPDTDFRAQWIERFSASNVKRDAGPDFIAATAGGQMLVSGSGACVTRALMDVVNTAATLRADESKPQ